MCEDLSAFQPNLDFYMNKSPSEPDGDLIENILNNWKGDYKKLESNCAYIQWLFPNKSQGKNPASYPLNEMEAEIIRQTPELKDRFKRAFKMMLDYFGMELDETRKCFTLASNSDERLKRINTWGNEAFLYISRILLALKECGFEGLMFPWMKFLAQLIYEDKTLDQAEESFEGFWVETLNDADRVEIQAIVADYQQ